jgi:hypothetical protein
MITTSLLLENLWWFVYSIHFFYVCVLYSSTVYHGFNGLHGVHERERWGTVKQVT